MTGVVYVSDLTLTKGNIYFSYSNVMVFTIQLRAYLDSHSGHNDMSVLHGDPRTCQNNLSWLSLIMNLNDNWNELTILFI